MKKIAIISPNFTEQRFRERWIKFSQMYSDYEIYLLIPNTRKIGYQKEYSFGKIREDRGEKFDIDRCHGVIFNLKYHKIISWTSTNLTRILSDIQPDIVYYIGLHNQESIVQILHSLRRQVPKSKFILFSMRGPQHNLRKASDRDIVKRIAKNFIFWYEKIKQKYIFAHTDAICCHYPTAKSLFELEGFKNSIFIQTQIGVNCEVYKKDLVSRKLIREKYKISDDDFVFGCAVRFAEEKGVSTILKSMSHVKAKLLLMGSGNEKEENYVDNLIKELGLSHKVIRTGFILGDEMAKYWNAVDCAIHVPMDTKNWVETFSLAVVQAMSVGLPIIGSDSGSVPYQIGFEDLIVPQNNSKELAEKMNFLMNNPHERIKVANKVYERTINNFEIKVLNKQMYEICESLLV